MDIGEMLTAQGRENESDRERNKRLITMLVKDTEKEKREMDGIVGRNTWGALTR